MSKAHRSSSRPCRRGGLSPANDGRFAFVAPEFCPPTEGIKYIGSKLAIIPHILRLSAKVGAKTVLDGFSGTTRVSQAFARSGCKVHSNDTAVWSEVFARCYLIAGGEKHAYLELIRHLNNVRPVDGWFTEHYGGVVNGGCAVQADGLKKPWQIHNTRKLDGIRLEIESMSLTITEKSVALASLILALDRVDNTLGHFASYLRDWSPRSYKTFALKTPQLFESRCKHQVHRKDIFDVAAATPVDLAYFDPPYGSNNEKMPPSRVRYASYYHLWKSICLFDGPDLFGKAKRRADTSDPISASVFEEFKAGDDGRHISVAAIDRLIESARARWIILSYSSGGRATAAELNEVLSRQGELREVVEIAHKKNVMTGMRWTNEWAQDAEKPNREFLFLLRKK